MKDRWSFLPLVAMGSPPMFCPVSLTRLTRQPQGPELRWTEIHARRIRVVVAKRIASSGVLAVVAAAMVFMSIMGITSVRAEPPGPDGRVGRWSGLCGRASSARRRCGRLSSVIICRQRCWHRSQRRRAADPSPTLPIFARGPGPSMPMAPDCSSTARPPRLPGRVQAARHRFIDVGCMQIDLSLPPHRIRLVGGCVRSCCKRRLCRAAAAGPVPRRGRRQLGQRRWPLSLAYMVARRAVPRPCRADRR